MASKLPSCSSVPTMVEYLIQRAPNVRT